MTDYDVPRHLPARTGRHICTNCLREVEPEEYFSYDLVCGECAGIEEYPLASTAGGDESAEQSSTKGNESNPKTAAGGR